jgi:hypothetical protein
MAHRAFGVPDRPLGMARRAFGMPDGPFGVAHRAFGVLHRPFGMAQRAFGVRDPPFGVAHRACGVPARLNASAPSARRVKALLERVTGRSGRPGQRYWQYPAGNVPSTVKVTQWRGVQSESTVQPQYPAPAAALPTHLGPSLAPMQRLSCSHSQLPAPANPREQAPRTHVVMHCSPLAPQAPSLIPVTHVVPLQHPPLQMAVVPSHEVEHVCVAGSHASLAGQAANVAQPQVPAKQPCDAPHDVHRPPFVPHAPAVSPVAHVPFEQHPPLHGVDDPHAVEHVPPLQARPGRQSPAAAHPHEPLDWHLRPIGLPAHDVGVHGADVSFVVSPPASTTFGASPGPSAACGTSARASPGASAGASPDTWSKTGPSTPASTESWPSWMPKSDVHPAAEKPRAARMAANRRHRMPRMAP